MSVIEALVNERLSSEHIDTIASKLPGGYNALQQYLRYHESNIKNLVSHYGESRRQRIEKIYNDIRQEREKTVKVLKYTPNFTYKEAIDILSCDFGPGPKRSVVPIL